MYGNNAIFDLIYDCPRVIRLNLAPFGSAAVILVVSEVILLLPMPIEQVDTIPPPRAVWEWAAHEIRDVPQ